MPCSIETARVSLCGSARDENYLLRRSVCCITKAIVGFILLTIANMVAVAAPVDQAEPAEAAAKSAEELRNREILNMDIEQLSKLDVQTKAMNVEVTSVTKYEGTVGRSAAAVFVISSDMIRRSACNNIPDLLRLVPGMEVARLDAHSWAISCRGLNFRYGNKLLVLLDGREIYTPYFGGVYWDIQDVLLEDIERIEVIRGPGGTLWGHDAVNGVINIITKKAKDTQEQLVTVGGGTENLSRNGFRLAGQRNEDLQYRIYGRHEENASGFRAAGAADDWREGAAGFRLDWQPGGDKNNTFTVQGDYYLAREGIYGLRPDPIDYVQTIDEDDNACGGNLLTRFTHVIDEQSDWSLLAYYDRFNRTASYWDQNISTFNVEFQHRFPLEFRREHEIVWGVQYRNVHDDEASMPFVLMTNPAQKTTGLFDIFVQDQIALVEDELFFTVGSKFERNDYTGFEYQPNVRLLYSPDKKHAVWGAISRSLHVPNRFDQDGAITFMPVAYPAPPGYCYPRTTGTKDFKSETVIAYEIGYRAQPHESFSYDIALYYNQYDDTLAGVRGTPTPDEYGNIIYPAYYTNLGHTQTCGVEVTSELAMSERWRLSAAYTLMCMNYQVPPRYLIGWQPGYNPRNQVRLTSGWDLGDNWQFDATLRYVDELDILNVPSYITMDLRLAWLPSNHIEVALIARNLLDSHHYEYAATSSPYLYPTEVERSVFGKLTLRY